MPQVIKWTDTERLEQLARRFKLLSREDETFLLPIANYRSKVKLHGTNAGIQIIDGKAYAQSRTQIITPQNDNAGFAAWVEETKGYWSNLLANWSGSAVVYGEWVGKGIQKGTAVNKIPEKSFAVFAVKLKGLERTALLTEPSEILLFLGKTPTNVYVLPWWGKELIISFRNKFIMKLAIKKINEMVAEVEACDPWVKDTFGIEGLGEGLVFFPIWNNPRILYSTRDTTDFLFKAKGEKHRVVKQRKSVQVDPEKANSVQEFISLVITDARLEQGLNETCGDTADIKKMGSFLKWVGMDVKKECDPELEASGLEWKDVKKLIPSFASKWFKKKLDEV